jgi:mono/diheme cytochrome c family protein
MTVARRIRRGPWPAIAGVLVPVLGPASGLALSLATAVQAPPSLAVALPKGEGRALVERACAGCHDPSLVMFKREDEESWAAIVNDMAARGARATEGELKTITAYLAEHFNRESTFSPLQGMGAAAAARDDQQLFAAGREIYQTLCSVCHQPDGRGRDRVAPPLVGAVLAMGRPAIAVRIMLHGKRGPANVMPALGTLMTDEQIAAALTYVRREWGQTGSAIQPATVKDIRDATAGRARPWTAEELQQFGGQSGKGAPYD